MTTKMWSSLLLKQNKKWSSKSSVKFQVFAMKSESTQWQMRITKNSVSSSPMTTKMWSSLLLKQNKKWSSKSSTQFQVIAVKSENGTINGMEDLLNLDLTPFTDKILAEYIWHMFLFETTCIEQHKQLLLFLKQHLDNLTNTSMAYQGLCSKIMQKTYRKN